MDDKQLKTSWRTRIVVGIIAFLMLFSTVAVYALIVLSGENDKQSNAAISEELAAVEAEMNEKRPALEALVKEMSKKYYPTLKKYRSLVKAYNKQSVNNAGLKTKDLEVGKGKKITEDSSYYSYYIGWCANETVFDSSFDDFDNPTSLIDPIGYTAGESNFIAGWEEGVIGMKIGGVREIDIPGELAYGSTQEICGETNMPLKYVVLAMEPSQEYIDKLAEYNKLYEQYIVLYYSQNQDELTSTE